MHINQDPRSLCNFSTNYTSIIRVLDVMPCWFLKPKLKNRFSYKVQRKGIEVSRCRANHNKADEEMFHKERSRICNCGNPLQRKNHKQHETRSNSYRITSFMSTNASQQQLKVQEEYSTHLFTMLAFRHMNWKIA